MENLDRIKFHINKKPKEQTIKTVFVTSTVIVLLVSIGIMDINNKSILGNTFFYLMFMDK